MRQIGWRRERELEVKKTLADYLAVQIANRVGEVLSKMLGGF